MGDLRGEVEKLLQTGYQAPAASPSTSKQVVSEQQRLAGISEDADSGVVHWRFSDYGREVGTICESTIDRLREVSNALAKYAPTTEEVQKAHKEARELRNTLKNLIYVLERAVKVGADLSNSLGGQC